MSIKYDSIKECRRMDAGFLKWVFSAYWSVNKLGEREWGMRFFGLILDNEPKGGTV